MRLKRDSKVEVLNKMDVYNKVEPRYDTKIYRKEDDCIPAYNDAGLKKLKRASPFGASHVKAKKVKHTAKEDGQSHGQRRLSSRSSDKVDAFEGNKYMNYKLNGYKETEKKRKTYGVVGCSLSRISEPNESDNDQCSVGSCSVPSDGYNKLSSGNDTDVLSSDGESFKTSRVEHEVAVSVHRLELHAYRSTLEALYASGPLSWEKEALLTNLRINLHISNDEHLTELRHLISSGARVD